MTVPGVSGGTMAVIAGVYEELIHAVNGLRKCPRRYLPFLVWFVCGAGTGFLLIARGITFLLDNEITGQAVCFFFGGAVIGGIPLLVEKSQTGKITLRHVLCLGAGALMVIVLSYMPKDVFTVGSGIGYIMLQAAGGFLVAVALVLPGISATHMLYILGLYNTVIGYIYSFKILELLPLAAGVLIGTFLTSDVLEKLIERRTGETYMVIIGFVSGSVVTLIPQPPIGHPLLAAVAFVMGFACMGVLARRAL